MPVVRVPSPGVVLLVGAAGAGKSTLAARLFRPETILSSDSLRLAIAGDAADQRRNRAVFAALHRELDRRLALGRLVVVDATNVIGPGRRELVAIAARHDLPVVAIVLDLPPDLVLSRNRTRPGRAVPDEVVARQLRRLAGAISRDAFATEGYAAVHRITTTGDLDGLEVELVAHGVPARSS